METTLIFKVVFFIDYFIIRKGMKKINVEISMVLRFVLMCRNLLAHLLLLVWTTGKETFQPHLKSIENDIEEDSDERN